MRRSRDAPDRGRCSALADRQQFADVYAISQLSPGPNVLIVTLIGYAVAGVAGALAATLAMCVSDRRAGLLGEPPADAIEPFALACHIQAALVPLSIGLMGASGLVLALTSDRTWTAGLVTAAVAVLAFATRLNPLWLLWPAVVLGFAGFMDENGSARVNPKLMAAGADGAM